MKKSYYYYAIYKARTTSFSQFLSNDFRADACIIALEIWLIGTINLYLAILFNCTTRGFNLTNPKTIITLIVVTSLTIYLNKGSRIRPYFEEFEKWPKRKRIIRSLIVWIIIALIVSNIFIYVELAHKLDIIQVN